MNGVRGSGCGRWTTVLRRDKTEGSAGRIETMRQLEGDKIDET